MDKSGLNLCFKIQNIFEQIRCHIRLSYTDQPSDISTIIHMLNTIDHDAIGSTENITTNQKADN